VAGAGAGHGERRSGRQGAAALPPFEQVVEEHGAAVLRACRAVVGPHDAEDAWSETFASALAAYPRLRPGSNIRGWLVTIAHRKAIDRIRAADRAPLPVERLPERHGAGGEPAPPETALLDALAALPTRQRAAVAYHYIADMPYSEVADLLGGTAAAARRSAADGIAALRLTVVEEDRS
jgi:RNA polymerase sigma factor (sigma-70 family)